MTENSTTTQPSTEAPLDPETPCRPADVLVTFITHLIEPMFRRAAGGDLAFASQAAYETVNGCRTQDPADLIAGVQVIANGLAALGSLTLSMTGDISLPMTLRLRGNANGLNRSAEQNRRALRESHAAAQRANSPAKPQPEAGAAEIRDPIDNPRPTPREPVPAAEPAPVPASPAARPLPADRQRQMMWAGAMTDVANEYTASIPRLPAAKRKDASLRAAVLNSTALDLIAGVSVPPLALHAILRPGPSPKAGPTQSARRQT